LQKAKSPERPGRRALPVALKTDSFYVGVGTGESRYESRDESRDKDRDEGRGEGRVKVLMRREAK
jgi:hypothetical protein